MKRKFTNVELFTMHQRWATLYVAIKTHKSPRPYVATDPRLPPPPPPLPPRLPPSPQQESTAEVGTPPVASATSDESNVDSRRPSASRSTQARGPARFSRRSAPTLPPRQSTSARSAPVHYAASRQVSKWRYFFSASQGAHLWLSCEARREARA